MSNFIKSKRCFINKSLVIIRQFWLENRTVDVKGHRLCRFSVEIDGPRPESYKEDYDAASQMEDVIQRQQFYIHTKSGAESGWDFSSRWYIVDEEGHNEGNCSYLNHPQ